MSYEIIEHSPTDFDVELWNDAGVRIKLVCTTSHRRYANGIAALLCEFRLCSLCGHPLDAGNVAPLCDGCLDDVAGKEADRRAEQLMASYAGVMA